VTSADQDQPSHHGQSALFAIESVHILEFSLKMVNGIAQIER
jgi:hypothetical protein